MYHHVKKLMYTVMTALDSMGLDPLQIGDLEPTPSTVRKYFNDSTGIGDYGPTTETGLAAKEGSRAPFLFPTCLTL